MEFPFAASRMLQDLLVEEGIGTGRPHVATPMKRMGIEPLIEHFETGAGHRIYPRLLRKLPSDALDLTLEAIAMRYGAGMVAMQFEHPRRSALSDHPIVSDGIGGDLGD